MELVRGKVTRVEHKRGRGLFFDITHKFGEPHKEELSWYLDIPPTADFQEGDEVTVHLTVTQPVR